jgi:hypothetical protein
MATRRWLGAAAPITQITTVTIAGTVAAAENFTLVIGSSSVRITTITGDTPTTVAQKLVAAMAISTAPPEFRDATYTSDAGVITCTGRFPGKPFTITGSETSTGATITIATPTAATGPNFFDNSANWTGGAVPVSTDTVYFQNSSVDCLYALANDSITLANLFIERSFTGNIGLPSSSDGGYSEYRTKYLRIKSTNVFVGRGAGRGSGRIRLDLLNHGADVTIYTTGSTNGENAAVQMLANSGTTVVTCLSGSLSMAAEAEETVMIDRLTVGKNAAVLLGSGVGVGLVNNDGILNSYTDLPTLNNKDGRATIHDSELTTLNQTGGVVFHFSESTIELAEVGPGTLSLENDTRSRTITDLTIRPGGRFHDPNKVAVLTNGISFSAAVKDVSAY